MAEPQDPTTGHPESTPAGSPAGGPPVATGTAAPATTGTPAPATTGTAAPATTGTAVPDAAGDHDAAPTGTATGTAPLTVAAVARRLGVAPATLRTWDRRYGLGPSEHSAGAHRRYTARDLERLLVMRRLTLEGVAPGEAARLALTSATEHTAPASRTSTDVTRRLPGGTSSAAEDAVARTLDDRAGDDPADAGPARTPVEPRTGTTPSTAAAVVAVVDAALAGRADRCA
ncbi:MerR family transcriptional regulator, partial [Cellulomonas sp. 179-A 9B4 NHS]|uniref:MerR family transcriptional regulator n=1 Tax=Cellulomonas sp. 179-A 9B4 NHS TaxID=3142379 RepID=UPI0039A1E39F